jgi:hypothetical protein
MASPKIDTFFSCSFREEDKAINDFFQAICRGSGLHISNVSTASPQTPPNEANAKINSSQALVAVCARRSELASGEFTMSDAIHHEIAFAFGKNIPVLMFVERNVTTEGFINNFGTNLLFDRNNISTPEFIEKAVEAVYNLRRRVDELAPELTYGMPECYAEHIYQLIELRPDGNDFIWQYSSSRRLVFVQQTRRGIPAGIWTTISHNLPSNAPNLQMEFSLISSSRNIELIPIIERQSPSSFEAILKMDPAPEEGDFIEYSTSSSSRYTNPVWLDEAPTEASIHLSSGDYIWADGLSILHETKRASLQFRIPKEYGMRKDELRVFAGNFFRQFNYEVESEKNRIKSIVEEFGGNIVIRMEMESPLVNHLYGVAWNPKKRPGLNADH